MKVCIAGKNDIAVRVLRLALEQLEAPAIGVLPNEYVPERHDWQLSLRQAARELGVRQVSLAEVYDVPDVLFLSVEYADLVRPALFASKNLVNIHFSRLPQYKGVHTSIWPIRNGEAQAGVTLHRIAPGIDTGDIIAQRLFPLEQNHTSRDLYFNFMKHGYELIAENFAGLLQATYAAEPQTVAGSSYYSRQSVDYAQIKVNFRATAWQVHNYVRAFAFPEYQLPRALGWALRGSELTQEPSLGKPGELVREDTKSLVVRTIDYNVRLLKDYSQQLFEAAQAGDVAAVRVAAAATHNLQATNRQGWSALMIAAYHHHPEVVAALLAAGADIHQANLNGTTMLMYAKEGALRAGNDTRLLDYLLAHGADINCRDAHNKTVLDYCRTNNNTKLIAYLQARGAR